MKYLNIKYKLLLYLLLPLLTILMAANTFFYFNTNKFLEKKSSASLFAQGILIKDESEHLVEGAERVLSLILLNRTIADYFLYSDIGLLDKAEDLRWEIEQGLLKVAKETPEYVTLRISGLDGKSIVDIINQKISYRHYDLSENLWFQEVLKSEEGRWAILYTICKEHNKPGVLFATSVYNDSGKKIGIASIHVHIEEFFKGLVDIKIGENGYAYLIDSEGMIIAHPDKNKIGIKIIDQKIINKLLSAKKGITEGSNENGSRLLKKVFIPLDIEGVGLVVAQPISEIQAFGKQVRFNSIILIFITVFVIVIISLMVANQFTKPIIKLKEMAVSVGDGNLNSKIDIKSNDEIGTLADAFNMMTQQIHESFSKINEEVTERKQAEEELKNYRDHLEELIKERTTQLSETNKELKEFAYIVSHDLKAPLRAISQLSHWISTDYKDAFDDEGKEMLSLLGRRVKRMDLLIDGILQYSRVGRLENEETIDLNSLVKEVISSLSAPENIEINVINTLPKYIGDPIRFTQVFQNLIGNSIKFIDKPKGKINIACIDEGKYWKFRVEDNGPGIEEKYFDKAFQIFQTLQPRDKKEGTGVGLSLIKKIVKLYKGDIWIESKMGEGTTVFFTLPKTDMDEKMKIN